MISFALSFVLACALQDEVAPNAPSFDPVLALGPIILRGSADAPMPDEFAKLGSERLVLAASKDSAKSKPGEIQLAADEWIADDAALTARLAKAERIDLASAAPPRWFEALYPKKSESRLMLALRERRRTGTPISAEGRAIGLLSGLALIRPGERSTNDRQLKNPRRSGELESFWGLGFFPWSLAVSAADLDASCAPIFATAFDRELRLAVFLPPKATLVADVQHSIATSRGSEAVLLFDLRGARRSRDWIQGMRWSVLNAGDSWNVKTRRATLAAGVEIHPNAEKLAESTIDRVLDLASIETALSTFASASVPQAMLLHGSDATLRLEIDVDTESAAHAAGVPPSFSRLCVDLVWAPEFRR